nr:DUF6078 family protein [uncultured Bacteroides sp.]
MKDDFDYQLVPSNYIHCLNQACPLGDNCLRRLAALHAPKKYPYLVAVNPAAYPEDATHCPHFKSSAKIRFAWGLTATFDNIPYKTALLLKRKIRSLYSRTTYYRILNKERSLSPAEQSEIAHIFEQNGITSVPVYDSYTEEYDWGNRENG